MQVEKIHPGTYVLAVSGGVDSMVLLDILAQQDGLHLVVAHFDHGMRPDSAEDEQFVHKAAKSYGLAYYSERGALGSTASEAEAREARYDFLKRVQQQIGATAIITAHHQDDVLETAILNVLRGTGRKGLSSLKSTEKILRPLLKVPKNDIKSHALKQKLSWREDSTNHDERYTRNYIRHRLLVRFDTRARQQLLAIIERQQSINTELDQLLAVGAGALDRSWFMSLPHDVAKEVMATWLRQNGIADFDRQTIDRLTIQAKTKPVGKRLDVLHKKQIIIKHKQLALTAMER